MLAAYYSCGCDSRELFAGFKIESDETFEKHLNQYDVIYLNMQQFLIEAEQGKVTEYLEQEVTEELAEEYGEVFKGRSLKLAPALRKIYAATGRQFVFLVDEWDCVMRERQESEELQKLYLDFLRNLLKDQPYVALAYMTGILPVKKYGLHSALNMFTEFSMTDQKALEEYTGFTEDEVKELCSRFDMDFEETGSWYDGYMFTKFQHIYNPKSVVEAMKCHKLSSYWTTTEVYDALKIYIDMDFDGLRADIVYMLGGGRVRINTGSFRNDMKNFAVKDDVLTLLVHLGYLGYDSEKEEVFIPNKEIIREFENAMRVGGWQEVMRVLKASEKLLSEDIRELTDRALWETENLIKCIPNELWDKRYDGLPMWKYVYHMLYSMDRWYINPCDVLYKDPDFHTETLADLNVVPKDECITRAQIEKYFYQIRDKIQNYVTSLADSMLVELPENCEISRFRLILGQFRHWHRHMGIVYGFIIEDTGKWPYVLNMNNKYPDSSMPIYYGVENQVWNKEE